MKRFTILLALAGLLCSANSFSQKAFENGMYLTPKGNLKVLMVFVAIDWGDSSHFNNGLSHGNWPDPNVVPAWSRTLYDSIVQTPQINETSKYFEELSFGDYHVTAGYHKDVIQLTLNDFFDTNGVFNRDNYWKAVETKIANMPLNSNGGFNINSYDQWSSTQDYVAKTSGTNGKIDHLMIFMRNHPRLGNQGGSTGRNSMDAFGTTTESASLFSANNNPFSISRHEYAHGMFGSNTYHSVGKPGGNWTFMWGAGGYGALSSSGGMRTLTGNAFDRNWVKYKPSANTHQISARSISGGELNAQLDSFKLDPSNPSGEYILRNFWNSGDAIRIKLPYVQRSGNVVIPMRNHWRNDTVNLNVSADVHNQYLWIENRQTTSSPYSLNSGSDEGMYAYIQVGRDYTDPDLLRIFHLTPDFSHLPAAERMDSVNQWELSNQATHAANYLHFLPSVGKYDYTYTSLNDPNAPNHVRASYSTSHDANPFTGYTHLMQPAWDNNSTNKISKGEGYWVKDITRNGAPVPASQFIDHMYGGGPGGVQGYDAFKPILGMNKIGIGHNPAATPLLTHNMPLSYQQPHTVLLYEYSDNKIIDLNNISVEILEQRANGDIKVKVRFDDYNVDQNVRWCGPLVLHDKAFVNAGATITIDQGRMPVRSKNPQTINGTKVFADKTSLLLVDNAKLQVQPQGKLELRGESTLKVQDNAVLNLEPNSTMNITGNSTVWIEEGMLSVKDGAVMNIYSGSKVYVQGEGTLQVKDGGRINVEPGAELIVRADPLANGSFEVGKSQAPGAPADPTPATIYVQGKLKFQYIDWKSLNKNGLFHFVAGSSVSLDPGKSVELTAPNNSTKVLKIDNHTLNVTAASFRIDNALVDISIGSKLKVNDADFELEDVRQTGGSIEADNPSSFEVLRHTAQNADEAIVIRNADASVGQARIRFSDFNSCKTAVKAYNVDHLRVYNTDISANGTNTTGINAELCRLVQYHGKLDVATTGAILTDVPGFYIAGSQSWIKTNGGTGILADNSQIFVRQGATISEGSMGVEIDGKYQSGAYTSMFTMGDVGCGSLIDNFQILVGRSPKYFDGSGVVGTNALVNVDALFHANAKASGIIQPNNVYGNLTDFDVCYTNLLVSPDTIFTRGNYWPLADVPKNESHWPYGSPGLPGSTSDDGRCRFGDKWKWSRLGLETSQRSTCEPTNDLCHTCGEKDFGDPDTYSALIIQNYAGTYTNFVDHDDDFGSKDTYESRTGFQGLANIELGKMVDTLEGSQWYVVVDGDNHPITTDAAHAIMVSRVIFNGRVAPSNARMKRPEVTDDIFDPYINKMKVKIVPNPAQYNFRVSVLGEELHKYSMRVYRSTGELAYEVQSFVDVHNVKTSDIGDMGIYFVEIISLESNERVVEKLIIEK